MALLLSAASVAIFSVPTQFEGPVLVRISTDHAIAVLDAVAIAPLFVASVLLYRSLWSDRLRLQALVQYHPGLAFGASFAGGAGLGLLLASVFTEFSGWWVIGAFLFAGIIVAAAWLGGQRGNAAA